MGEDRADSRLELAWTLPLSANGPQKRTIRAIAVDRGFITINREQATVRCHGHIIDPVEGFLAIAIDRQERLALGKGEEQKEEEQEFSPWDRMDDPKNPD